MINITQTVAYFDLACPSQTKCRLWMGSNISAQNRKVTSLKKIAWNKNFLWETHTVFSFSGFCWCTISRSRELCQERLVLIKYWNWTEAEGSIIKQKAVSSRRHWQEQQTSVSELCCWCSCLLGKDSQCLRERPSERKTEKYMESC